MITVIRNSKGDKALITIEGKDYVKGYVVDVDEKGVFNFTPLP